MLLSDWLREKGITRVEFAARVGVSPGHITGICDGTTWPSRRVVTAIRRETVGAVTADDFLDLGHAPSNPEAA